MGKNDLGDTAEALAEDKKFLVDLEKNCETKQEEWATIVKTRNEELLALADTIKILNDDDALELFKKTLPSPSFLQRTGEDVKQKALMTLKASEGSKDFRLNLIALALRGHSKGFESVIKMIDDMV